MKVHNSPKKTYIHKSKIPKSPNKYKKNIHKEMDYEKAIKSLMFGKYLALASMDYMDDESDKLLDKPIIQKYKAKSPRKPRFNPDKINIILGKNCVLVNSFSPCKSIKTSKSKDSDTSNLRHFSAYLNYFNEEKKTKLY